MTKQILFSCKEQVESIREKIIHTTNEKFQEFIRIGEGIDFMKKIRFSQCGYDPLFKEPINFIEQANQTFTYLVCLDAVKLLLSKYPTYKFFVNFGTEPGNDIISEDGSIICECFAATAPDSNGKLEHDTKKVYSNQIAVQKYVIYYASTPKLMHVENIRNKYRGVEIISLENI